MRVLLRSTPDAFGRATSLRGIAMLTDAHRVVGMGLVRMSGGGVSERKVGVLGMLPLCAAPLSLTTHH